MAVLVILGVPSPQLVYLLRGPLVKKFPAYKFTKNCIYMCLHFSYFSNICMQSFDLFLICLYAVEFQNENELN